MNVDSEKILMDLGADILAEINNINQKTYLELGVRDNKTYNKVNAKSKMGVDTNGAAPFVGTTDEYFEQNPDKRYDIVFIDACHDKDFVLRDFNNSIRISNEWVVLHDMIPPTEFHTRQNRCSDSYRILYRMLTATDFEVYTMNENMGLTFVRMPATEIQLTDAELNLTYSEYVEFMSDKKLYNRREMLEVLND